MLLTVVVRSRYLEDTVLLTRKSMRRIDLKKMAKFDNDENRLLIMVIIIIMIVIKSTVAFLGNLRETRGELKKFDVVTRTIVVLS